MTNHKKIILVLLVCGFAALPFSSHAMFSGNKITATINGQQAVLADIAVSGVDQKTFGAGPGKWLQISGLVKIKVDYDKSMGDLKSLEVFAYGLKEGKIDYTAMYVPDDPAKDKVPVGQETEIKKWDKFLQKFDSLPAGQYVLHIHLNTQTNWDTQIIALEVK